MANFKTHLSVAAAGSCAATLACTAYFHLSIVDAVVLFTLGTVAGLLPDVDSDHSIPARWLFRLVMLGGVSLVLAYSYSRFPLLYAIAYACLTVFLLHFVLFKVFKSITSHRGLFHSVPAAMVFGLAMHALGVYALAWPLLFTWLAASFVAGGYVLHLFLDEIYSVDLAGRRLKKSFGSALTLIHSSSYLGYSMLYLMVMVGILFLPMPEPLSSLSQHVMLFFKVF